MNYLKVLFLVLSLSIHVSASATLIEIASYLGPDFSKLCGKKDVYDKCAPHEILHGIYDYDLIDVESRFNSCVQRSFDVCGLLEEIRTIGPDCLELEGKTTFVRFGCYLGYHSSSEFLQELLIPPTTENEEERPNT